MANEYCAKVSYEDKTLIDLTKDTVSATYVMSGKKFHDNSGAPVTGTMPTRGSGSASISTKSQEVNLQYGYYDGSGRVSIASAEQAKIIAENIKKDVTILGVTGTHEGGGSYEEETLPTGGTWAKIDCGGSPEPGPEPEPEPIPTSDRYTWSPYIKQPTNFSNLNYYDYKNSRWSAPMAWEQNLNGYMATSGDESYVLHIKFKPASGYTVDTRVPESYEDYVSGGIGSVIIYDKNLAHGGTSLDLAWWTLYRDPSDYEDGWWHIKACTSGSWQYGDAFWIEIRGKSS